MTLYLSQPFRIGALFLFFLPLVASAEEPLQPIPEAVDYDRNLAELGKRLFFDPVLSGDRTISCASCHDPYNGGDDNRSVSTGILNQKGNMNSPTVLNSYFNFRQFWNGRSRDLKEQAAGPIHNPVEMGLNGKAVEERLNKDPYYTEAFRRVTGKSTISFEDVTRSIAEFEKALFTPNSRFDRYLRGEIRLSNRENKGFLLFKKFGCVNCHNGVNLGGNSYQKIGVIHPFNRDKNVSDRYAITKKPYDKNVYKVPTLRNIDLTAPYFHDGSAKTLEDAISKMAFHNLGRELTPSDTRNLIAFLKSLTGETPEILKSE